MIAFVSAEFSGDANDVELSAVLGAGTGADLCRRPFRDFVATAQSAWHNSVALELARSRPGSWSSRRNCVNTNISTRALAACAAATLLACAAQQSSAQSLYAQNFDTDDTANWTVNGGPTDETAEFNFDYSAFGIPSAPRSTGATTRGMRLRCNLTDGVFGGFSVSPTGKSFTGDYTLRFDWWHNYLGPLDNAAVAGSSMLSTFGILSSGAAANYAGAADSVFFAAVGNGGSAADYRAYSSERAVSYQVPPDPAAPEDLHATYEAGSRNNSAEFYTTNFPGGVSAPTLQQTTYPDEQINATLPGTMGFGWHDVRIQRAGALVKWFVDDVLLITVDTTSFTVPTGGNNILFGHADINATIGTSPNYAALMFTLIDNVRVIDDDAIPGDANLDEQVDITDLGILATNWQLGGVWETGDFDGSDFVDITDLGLLATNWQVGVGDRPTAQPWAFDEALAAVGLPATAVPEPLACSLAPAIAMAFLHRPRHRRRSN
jgi:hypothetical protein